MNINTYSEVQNFIMSFMADPQERRALIETALFNEPILNQIDWSGDTNIFTASLLTSLIRYGVTTKGDLALIVLLEYLVQQIDIDQRDQVKEMIVSVRKHYFSLLSQGEDQLSRSEEKRFSVFISSTSIDLKQYRQAVTLTALRLGIYPIVMEAFNPTESSAIQLCYDQIQGSDIFVGIYAHRYGYVPNEGKQYTTKDGKTLYTSGKKSIVQLEYEWALDLKIPMLLFILKDKDDHGKLIPWAKDFIEDGSGKIALDKFKNILKENHVIGFYSSPDNLSSQVATGLLKILLRSSSNSENKDAKQNLTFPDVVGERLMDVSTYFRDRKKQREQIETLLADSQNKLVSIIGRGGMGKTSLASQILSDIEKNKWLYVDDKTTEIDGIIYLSTRTDGISLENVFLRFATLLGKKQGSEILKIWSSSQLSIETKISLLIEKVKNKSLIILLDNMEDILDSDRNIIDADLRSFLEIALGLSHKIRFLITTREPISLPSKYLRYDNRIILQNGLPDSDAVQVLRDLDPHGLYGLRDADQKDLTLIAHKVHGVPRALEVIASILANDITESLDSMLADIGILQHERFVEDLVKENYRRLSINALYVVIGLAIFRRPISSDAIEFLYRELIEKFDFVTTLTNLVQTHTLNFHRETKLISLHPIDQDYVYNHISTWVEDNINTSKLHHRAAEYYKTLQPPLDKISTREELKYYILAFDQLFNSTAYDEACKLLNLIDYNYLTLWGFSSVAVDMRKRLLGKINNAELEVINNNYLGYSLYSLGAYEESLEYLLSGLKIANSTNNLVLQLDLYNNLGRSYYRFGNQEEAIKNFKEAIYIAENLQRIPSSSSAHANLALAYVQDKQLKKAEIVAKKALELSKDINDPRAIGRSLDNLGVVYYAQGYFEEAVKLHLEALELNRQTSNMRGQMNTLINLGNAYASQLNYEKSLHNLQDALDIAKNIHNTTHEAEIVYKIKKVAEKMK